MILNKIIDRTKFDLEKQKQKLPFNILQKALSHSRSPLDPLKSLKDGINIIAEVKKASPSKGVIRDDFDPLQIALEYERAGAWAISVLCEPHYFLGSIEYLGLVRRFVNLPLLRKDFIIDRYQIAQARIYGADMILLIAKALDTKSLIELSNYANELNLTVLMEIHDEEDLEKALQTNAKLIGINHRNLKTFDMDMELSLKLKELIPSDRVVVAESGLYSYNQILSLNQSGIRGFLIGEHFMRQDDIYQAVMDIRGVK
ncbi:indole-3-glycerol-phosphate synthase [Campylobacter devanensis]|uniref:Indole-3-glycerol phosphate synthase n=1 Tax=Campylobacter devanensis TaxID=3161138 RepID=A0A1X9SSQ6_9BACT|nr:MULTISPECIES: indole-3-glycerol phosphate synthase TrpC [Campylobacter]ARQ99294.1 indole-3-glycerol phosphate synthase [Campylobacter lanienae]SUX02482.1 indole-3-glycerol-phosphate synthase [Campylobacter lanienae]